MKLTKKQQLYIEYSCNNPLVIDAEIARALGITHKQICNWKKNPEFKAEVTKELDKRWAEARKIAQQTMCNLAANGDYKAAEFLMKTNGVNPTEKVDVNANINTIRVTIEDD